MFANENGNSALNEPIDPHQNQMASGSSGSMRHETIVAQSPRQVLEPKEPPPPPTRSSQAKSGLVVFLNFIMSSLVFATLVICAVVYLGKRSFEQQGPLDTAQTLVVAEGSSVAKISDQLRANGIISNDMIFRAGVRAYRASGSMKAGEYLFKPRMSMYEVMETIRSGKGILHKVTIPEGLTVHQAFERITQSEILVGDLPDMPPEGSLMPDTYPFQRGTTRAELVDRMIMTQARFLQSVWKRRTDDLPISTPEEMVVLASIVEKETGKADERPRVASVFINRLRKGMKLQSDPTIIYGIFGGKGKPKDRPIYQSDIDNPTEYNTYSIEGLPPGPIANPGRAALEAVANPSRTEELYFVADGTGGHVFARTLEEHNDNVQRWRAIQKQLEESAADAASQEDTGTASQ